jgi:hypothetical protein
MRALKLFGLLLIIVELILVLAFVAGYHYSHDWRIGLLTLGVTLFVLTVPWVGEARLQYDSAGGQLDAAFGWWGRILIRQAPEPIRRLRILGIPLNLGKKPRQRKPRVVADLQQAARWTGENFDDLVRLALSALKAGHELAWEAKELRVRVQSPVQTPAIDQAFSYIVGHRRLGPADIEVTAGGSRRVQVWYRGDMLQAGLLGLTVVADVRRISPPGPPNG